MPDIPDIAQINEFLIAEFRIPSITAYNRLEARPRTADFNRSLKAEVRDALWMLTRQWQFGEFKGEDAATAVTTQVEGHHTTMDKIEFPGNTIFPFNEKVPLETTVEREVLKGNLFLAVQMARYFVKLMKDPLLPSYDEVMERLRDRYSFNYFPDDNDQEGNQLLNAVTGKLFDGFLLYQDIITVQDSSTVFATWLMAESVPDSDKLMGLAELFRLWHERNYSQPAGTDLSAWQPSKLEYKFAVSSPGDGQQQKTLVAERYHEGHLDWYSFDLKKNANVVSSTGTSISKSELKSYIPSPVVFKGMPNPRFWMMENSQTDFGKIDTTPTGMLHLLLAEFGLTYSNDWFMIPYELTINTLCEIKRIIVKDVFGQYTLIRPAGTAEESQWQQWAMFRHTDISEAASRSNLFYLAPAITKLQQSEPLEVVNFLRDEMANMVWAVENTVPSQAGKGVNGNEMALVKNPPAPFVGTPGVAIRYVLGTTVPENWIPFIPVHMEGSVSEIKLQRATLPHAKGALGVIVSEVPAPYYVQEEIVQRSGILVNRMFQRTRGNNGEVYLWLGRNKTTGKGEGWSNLKFDQIENI